MLSGDIPAGFRSGFIAVTGRPNAGKSTLVNRLVGEHVAIVSPIAQTTRRVVRAVRTSATAQLVFVDLPGSQRPVDRLTARMQGAVESELGDVDAVLWVIDGRDEPRAGERVVSNLVFEHGVPVLIALNKVDRMKPNDIAHRIGQLAEIIGDRQYEALVPVSALHGEGCEELLAALERVLPEGPPWYAPGDVTDMRATERISEYIREAALRHLRDELPHATIVEVEEMLEEPDQDSLRVSCTIWVERESQVGIVVGKRGATIREIGTEVRPVIQELLGRHVFLDLRVKVRRRWRDDDVQLSRWGL